MNQHLKTIPFNPRHSYATLSPPRKLKALLATPTCYYGHEVFTHEVSPQKPLKIGFDCDLIRIASPYTYIAMSEVICVAINMEDFLETTSRMHPKVLVDLKGQAIDNLKARTINSKCVKSGLHSLENSVPYLRGLLERERSERVETDMIFPLADRNCSNTL